MAEENMRFCPICNYESNSIEDMSIHINTSIHRFNYLLKQWCNDRKSLVQNRHGIEVTVAINGRCLNHANNGKHYYQISPNALFERGNYLDFECTIKNTRNDPIHLTNANLLHPYSWFSLIESKNIILAGNVVQLMPNISYRVTVRFSSGDEVLIGGYNIPVCFSFQTAEKKADVFKIARSINILIQEDIEEFHNESPFTGNPWAKNVYVYDPVRSRPYSDSYTIPFSIKKYLFHGLEDFPGMKIDDQQALAAINDQLKPGNVTASNYRSFWHHVLWLEEVGQELGLRQYNMENVSLNLMESGLLELVVPGLAEKRPSVVVGDLVDIRLHDDHTGYRGVIQSVNDLTVEISNVNEELINIIENMGEISDDFDVKFVMSRLTFERCHQGVDSVVNNDLLKILFPPTVPLFRKIKYVKTVSDAELYNELIRTNQEQKTAVCNILNATSAPYPYIVFGPPGTGKTVTIVEAILQIKRKTTHNILVCAASNAACDVLTEKLLAHCDKSELIRVMSNNVDISIVHKVVLTYSNYDAENDVVTYVDAAALSKYRIIVTTLVLIGKYAGLFRPDVLFIDEAAQAFEPQACIALGMLGAANQIVLAGDHKQLGPSVSSDAAKNFGLDVSLLERLMHCNIYEQMNPNCITMLIKNYRSHEMILRLPNSMFYDNKLEAKAVTATVDPITKIFVFQQIQELHKSHNVAQKKGQPIEFCNVISKERREGKSPSYYNQTELQTCIKYIEALLSLKFENKEYKVLTSHIGVITPYVRQVHKLKYMLKHKKIEGVEVGTAETFQGREKRVIIISTVRAKKDLLLYDKLYKLGFVKDDKRFNVAITRGMSKVIVIGCAHVLGTDQKWLKYIDYCESVHGYCGAPFARRTDNVIEDISSRIGNNHRDTQYH